MVANAQPETEGPKQKEEKRPSTFEKVKNWAWKGVDLQSGQNFFFFFLIWAGLWMELKA